jgi:hypothetical protein
MSTSPLQQYPEFYSQDDIQQILHLAIARQAEQEELTREQLWEIAAELEIDKQAIEAAEKDWLLSKNVERKRLAFDLYRRNRLKQKAIKYLIVNVFLVSFNLLVAGTVSWSLYIMLIWGFTLALNAWKTYQNQGEEYERAFQKWDFQNEFRRTVGTVWSKIQQAWQI